MLAWLRNFYAVVAAVGPIEDRGDIIALKHIYNVMLPILPFNLVQIVLIMAHGVREPELVNRFRHDLTATQFVVNNDAANVEIILDCFSSLVHMPVKREFLPARLFNNYARPANMLRNFDSINLLAFANLVTQRLAGDLTSMEHHLIVREMRQFRGVGNYWAKHFFRTLTIVLDRPFPGSSFVVMGSGADKAAYGRLRALGVHNMDELNVYLVKPLDAGRFAYYVCMGKL
jgi:hypothetical protein